MKIEIISFDLKFRS